MMDHELKPCMKKIISISFILFFACGFSTAQKNKRVPQGKPFSTEMNSQKKMGESEGVSSDFSNGVKEFKDRNFKSSLESFNKFLLENPEDVAAHYNRGLTYYFMEDIDHACMDWKFASYFDDFLSLRNYKSVCDSSFDAVVFLNGGMLVRRSVYDEIYKTAADQTEPSYPGGQDELNKFLQKNLSINPASKKIFLESRVIVKLNVKEDGSISNPSIVRKKDPELESEALRVVSMMPKWLPAKRNGSPVDSEFYYPVINGRDSIRKSNKIYKEGVEHVNKSDYSGALALFTEVIRINEADADARNLRALCYLHLGDTSNACADLKNPSLQCVISVVQMQNKYCHENISLENLPAIESTGQGIFTIVENMPSFASGEKAMLDFISSNVKYPDDARKKKISGRVYVSFIIDKEGYVREPKVLRGIGGGCDEEAIRVVQMMPQWIPGSHGGRLRNVQFNLPINFTLSK